MKFIYVLLSLLCNISSFAALPHEKLVYPELHFEIPEVQTIKLDNGLLLFYIQDKELPIMRAQLHCPGGYLRDPREKSGLSNLISTVQRDGGTKKHKVEEINEILEPLGAAVEAGSDSIYNTVKLQCLEEDFKTVLDVFFEIALSPSFDNDKLELERANIIESLKRRDDDASKLAARKFIELLYPEHPRGYETTIDSVSNITRDELIKEHDKRFQPEGAQLLVVGSMPLETVKSLLKPYVKNWKQSSGAIAKVPEMSKKMEKRFSYIKKDIPQFKIKMGHKGVKLSNPDYAALQVMNYILGGGSFNSRLTNIVRTKMGLTYSIYSYMWGDWYYGPFGISCDTGADTASKAVKAIMEQVKEIRKSQVTDKEIQVAKESLINSYVFKFSSSQEVAERLLYYHQRNLPMNFLQTYMEKLKAVTKADVLRVAKKYLAPEEMRMVLVGPFEKYKTELESAFGKFKEMK
jgi:predicted Zn-dependent peptidase